MNRLVFSGTAWVEIQGDCVLRLVDRWSDHSEYQVHGFQDSVIINDYREATQRALANIMDHGQDVREFAPHFNTPALVQIKSDSSNVSIQLKDTDDHDPQHRLWIAIGIRDSIPVYDYIFDRLVPMSQDDFAFVALYRRVYRPELASTPLFCSV